jgi:Fe-S-cluster containining protein
MDFKPYFKHYEAVVAGVEAAFSKIKDEYSDCVRCGIGCADCCHALFDLTLIEALYINHKFNQHFEGEARERLLDRANSADRRIYRIKKAAHKDHEAGKSEDEILKDLAGQRVRCPLLNDDDQCDLYDHRPITCRLYGVPTEIGGQAHTCGLSAFEAGNAYPTVKLEQIHQRLYDISFALAQDIRSRYPDLSKMLVPLSMALLTEYSMDYLGSREGEAPSESE